MRLRTCGLTNLSFFGPFSLLQQPPPGERKLYLLIEGPTERSVREAKAKVKEIIEQARHLCRILQVICRAAVRLVCEIGDMKLILAPCVACSGDGEGAAAWRLRRRRDDGALLCPLDAILQQRRTWQEDISEERLQPSAILSTSQHPQPPSPTGAPPAPGSAESVVVCDEEEEVVSGRRQRRRRTRRAGHLAPSTSAGFCVRPSCLSEQRKRAAPARS